MTLKKKISVALISGTLLEAVLFSLVLKYGKVGANDAENPVTTLWIVANFPGLWLASHLPARFQPANVGFSWPHEIAVFLPSILILSLGVFIFLNLIEKAAGQGQAPKKPGPTS